MPEIGRFIPCGSAEGGGGVGETTISYACFIADKVCRVNALRMSLKKLKKKIEIFSTRVDCSRYIHHGGTKDVI